MSSAGASLAPALGETFLIIGLGYVLTRTGVFTKQSASHLARFVAYVALPALLFRALALLNFDNVDPYFVLGIAMAKTILFVAAVLMNLVVNWKNKQAWALSGIRGIFVTQSNDMALGIPIVKSLYSVSHPQFITYQYLLQVIGLLFLNPIGFTMIEFGTRDHNSSSKQILWRVAKRVITNPIVFMVFLGILWNRLVCQPIPYTIDQSLILAGQAFGAAALFCLGSSMVGLSRALSVRNIFLPLTLVIFKILVAPIVHKLCVGMMGIHGPLGMYAFIYGALPTAPVVFVWAKTMNIDADVLAASVVLCTVASAPVTLVSAKVAAFASGSLSVASMFLELVWETAIDSSWMTIVGCMWVLLFTLLIRKHTVMLNLVRLMCVWQLCFSAVTVICPKGISVQSQNVRFGVLFGGLAASKAAAAAIVWAGYMMASKRSAVLEKMQWALYVMPAVYGLGSAGIMAMVGVPGLWTTTRGECVGGYGSTQTWTTWWVDLILLAVTTMGLIGVLRHYSSLHFKQLNPKSLLCIMHDGMAAPFDSQQPCRSKSTGDLLSQSINIPSSDFTERVSRRANSTSVVPNRMSAETAATSGSSSESAGSGSSRDGTSAGGARSAIRSTSSGDVRSGTLQEPFLPPDRTTSYGSGTSAAADSAHGSAHSSRSAGSAGSSGSSDPRSKGLHPEDMQPMFMHGMVHLTYLRVVLLGLYFTVSLLIGVILMMIKLIMHEDPSGPVYEMAFLSIALERGVGLMVFLTFGVADDLARPLYSMSRAIVKLMRSLMFHTEVVPLAATIGGIDQENDVDYLAYNTVLDSCHRFEPFIKKCVRSICKDRRYGFSTFKKVFFGDELINYLLDHYLVTSREDGLRLGRQLMYGGVIEHVKREHNFYDEHNKYFYRFSRSVVPVETLPE